MKLTKKAAKSHQEALALVRAGRPLDYEERLFVLENYHEGAEHMNAVAGAFFTPPGLARDLAIEVPECGRILDLCAGIGSLSYWSAYRAKEVVCVELNPFYVEVGKRVLPEATWVTASIFDDDAYGKLGPFDVVISNPPFGRIKAPQGFEGLYTGGLFEYRAIELASTLGEYGVFIIPATRAPFRYSGVPSFRKDEDDAARRFREQTGIVMEPNSGFDTTMYLKDWKGVSPTCEIVCCDFSPRETRLGAQGSLF